MAETKASAEALVPRFQCEKVLNQDQAGRRTSLYGTIDGEPALLVLERAPFPESQAQLSSIPSSLAQLKNLGANDIYHWYMARTGVSPDTPESSDDIAPDLKINLIYPCTETHVRKYSKQRVRYVTETPEIYAQHIRPYMQKKREEGRLNWVFNIIDGLKEVEDVIYRTPLSPTSNINEEGFLLLPDLNWDRKTVEALHLLAIVERRDIWSLRDLKKSHVEWLKSMRGKLMDATLEQFKEQGVERDEVKMYVHYQPTYYHFHVHIVHVSLEAGATQAVGKAMSLDLIVEMLEMMGGEEDVGLEKISLGYTLGEESELWRDIFAPLKEA